MSAGRIGPDWTCVTLERGGASAAVHALLHCRHGQPIEENEIEKKIEKAASRKQNVPAQPIKIIDAFPQGL
jgi:hypothetical protein